MSTLLMHVPFPKVSHRHFHGGAAAAAQRSCIVQCSSKAFPQIPDVRRSANYKPSFWDFDYIQSRSSEYTDERYRARAAEMILRVKMLLRLEKEDIRRLELIDDLQRLGLSYHFEDEIDQTLKSIYLEEKYEGMDLYSTALAFRLLRQHGFRVNQEVFDCFKNEEGDFRSSISDDTRGLLQMYEASFLLTEGEETLELAKEFATNSLQRKLLDEDEEGDLLASIRHALELPIHWRIQNPNARWFIDVYEKRSQMNPILLELAKLDFNIIQALQQQEIKLISRWWEHTRLPEKLPFARDRVVECYLWALRGIFKPQDGHSRMIGTKINIFVTIIDDIFDVYGTLEELRLFNNAIERWDLEGTDQLPYYMQTCFFALNNLVDEIAYDVMKEQEILIIQHLRKSWADLFRSFLQEAEWHAEGYIPTYDEYISNGWISSSGHVLLSHAFFLITNLIEMEDVRILYEYHNIVRCPAMIFRLTNDLVTSENERERGDVAGSVECYMKENGASREEAQEHVKLMIWESWKRMNQELIIKDSKFSKDFTKNAVDLGRISQYMYEHGDGHGVQNLQIKDRISRLFFEPIV